MADKYDKNGYNSSDFKRNMNQESEQNQQDGEEDTKINKKAGDYMKELLSEKIKLNHQKFPLSSTLIDQEVNKVQTTGRVPIRDNKYLDVYKEKPIKLIVKVLVPVKEHPKFNFIGKLMGPKGNTMKHLQEETMCKMAVLGRGSMRDRQKEEELRNSLDPKYAHLSDELHVEVSALAPPAEAHARIAYALAEVKKYLIPDHVDGMMWPGQMPGGMRDRAPTCPLDARPALRVGPIAGNDGGNRHQQKFGSQAGPSHPPYAAHGPPAARPAPRLPPPAPLRAMPPPKPNKVLSILDRARSAMESGYGGYDDGYAAPEPPAARGPPRGGAPEAEFYYDRAPERFYEDDSYGYKEEGRGEYDAGTRDVGTRRPRYARPTPYARAPKAGGQKRKQ